MGIVLVNKNDFCNKVLPSISKDKSTSSTTVVSSDTNIYVYFVHTFGEIYSFS